VAALIPACFKGPDGTPKDSALAQCFTAAGIPNDAEGDPDIKTCPQLESAKKCAADSCGGKIPVMFEPMIKELNAGLKCGSSGGCNILEASQCMTGLKEQIAAAGADQTKMCALIPKLKACFPAACADNASAKAALAGYAEAEKACASGGGGGPISGGGGGPCHDTCGKAVQECLTKDPQNAACMTDFSLCSLKCSMPGIDPAQLEKVATCMAWCQKDRQTAEACSQKCMEVLIPDCPKGPNGKLSGKDSALGKCMTAAGIPSDACRRRPGHQDLPSTQIREEMCCGHLRRQDSRHV
jgi:hypothetical protein